MKKILMIGFTKKKYMPYIFFYLNSIEKNNLIDLIVWNRDESEDIEIMGINKTYIFKCIMSDDLPIYSKIPFFLKYRKFAKGIIRNNKYDGVIILHSTPAVLLHDIIISKYGSKYILDYRDVTYERIQIYKRLISKLVENSYATFVSSPGFLKYLPKSKKINISHNIQNDLFTVYDYPEKKNRVEFLPMKICFWGLIRQKEFNIRLIDTFANDSRFELNYYGREQYEAIEIKKYCFSNAIENVHFFGEYKPHERLVFAQSTNIINNMYEFGKTEGLAMGNKYYDGIFFHIPQICSPNSYMGKMISEKNIGFIFDFKNTNVKEELINYFNSLDWNQFDRNCSAEKNRILREYKRGKMVIKNFVEGREFNAIR